MADFRVPPCGKRVVCRAKRAEDTESEAEEAFVPTRVTMCLPMVAPDTAMGGRKIPKDSPIGSAKWRAKRTEWKLFVRGEGEECP